MGRYDARRSMRVHSLFRLAFLYTLSACDRPAPQRLIQVAADTITVEQQRCILPAGTVPSDSAAIRCAELYVARNGYTDLPPVSDTAQRVGEFLDLGIEDRRNTLVRRAAALCRGDDHERPAFSVIFRRTSGEGARSVLLNRDLSMMGIMHQDAEVPGPEYLNGPCSLIQ